MIMIHFEIYFPAPEENRPGMATATIHGDKIQIAMTTGKGLGYIKRALLAYDRLRKKGRLNDLTVGRYCQTWIANVTWQGGSYASW